MPPSAKKKRRSADPQPAVAPVVSDANSPSPTVPVASVSIRSTLFAVAIVALVVRIAYLVTAHGPAFTDPLVDADYYDYLGERIAHGAGFDAGPFWQPPLYPALLGAIYRVTGHTLFAPRLMQVCFGAFAAAGTALLAHRATGSRGAAWIAGLLVALHGVLVFYDGELLAVSLAIALTTGALLVATARTAPTRAGALASGGLLGLAALAVAPSALIAPAIAMVWWRRARRESALVLVALACVLVACAGINRARSGEWVLISANGGVNLWLGNNPDGERALAIRPGAAWEAMMEEPVAAGARTATDQDRWFRNRALSFCASNPGSCSAGLAHKAHLLVASREMPRNENIYLLRGQSPVLAALVWHAGSIGFPGVVVFPLAAMGAVFLARRKRVGDPVPDDDSRSNARWILFAALVASAIGPLVFFVTSRHRAPMIPLACVAAGIAVVEWRSRRGANAPRERNTAIALVFGALVALAAVWPLRYATDAVAFEPEMHFEVAGRRARRGDTNGAIESLRTALQLRPDYREAAVNLALLYQQSGDTPHAVALITEMAQLYPDDPSLAAMRDALMHPPQ